MTTLYERVVPTATDDPSLARPNEVKLCPYCWQKQKRVVLFNVWSGVLSFNAQKGHQYEISGNQLKVVCGLCRRASWYCLTTG